MLEVTALGVNYDEKEILKNISFSLGKGETLSIIGPSGCGKSTLLLALDHLVDYQSGEIENYFKDTGLILQQHGLFPWKTVKENIRLPLLNQRIAQEEIELRIKQITKELKISHLLGKYPAELSGGERQRASVARSLGLKPELLLLDEPSSALDSINKENFQNVLCQLQKEYAMAYIIVTHNIEEAVVLGQRIAIMKEGQIQEIISNPYYGRHEVRKTYEFFDKCNEIRERLEKGEKG